MPGEPKKQGPWKDKKDCRPPRGKARRSSLTLQVSMCTSAGKTRPVTQHKEGMTAHEALNIGHHELTPKFTRCISFLELPLTKYQKLGGLKQEKYNVSQLW